MFQAFVLDTSMRTVSSTWPFWSTTKNIALQEWRCCLWCCCVPVPTQLQSSWKIELLRLFGSKKGIMYRNCWSCGCWKNSSPNIHVNIMICDWQIATSKEISHHLKNKSKGDDEQRKSRLCSDITLHWQLRNVNSLSRSVASSSKRICCFVLNLLGQDSAMNQEMLKQFFICDVCSKAKLIVIGTVCDQQSKQMTVANSLTIFYWGRAFPFQTSKSI